MAKNTWSMSVVLTSQDPKTKYNSAVGDYAPVDTILRLVRIANALGRGYRYTGNSIATRNGIRLAFQVGLLHRVDRCTDHPDTKGYWITGEQA